MLPVWPVWNINSDGTIDLRYRNSVEKMEWILGAVILGVALFLNLPVGYVFFPVLLVASFFSTPLECRMGYEWITFALGNASMMQFAPVKQIDPADVSGIDCVDTKPALFILLRMDGTPAFDPQNGFLGLLRFRLRHPFRTKVICIDKFRLKQRPDYVRGIKGLQLERKDDTTIRNYTDELIRALADYFDTIHPEP